MENVTNQFQLTLEQKNILLKTFFQGILNSLKEFKLKDYSPSVFLIYAHDSKNKNDLPANANEARLLIKWLYDIGINLYSDRRSEYVTFLTQGEKDKAMDLLKNQFDILPDSKEKSYQHIILCGSQLLKSHTLKKAQSHSEKTYFDLYRNQITNVLGVSEDIDNKISKLRRELNHYLTEHKDEAFHHVLTELAFLDLRFAKVELQSSVIPVLLNGSTQDALPPFITTLNNIYSTKWYKRDEQWKGKEVYEQEGLQWALFHILKCLYVGKEKILKYIEECESAYKTVVEDCRQNKLSQQVIDESLQELERERQRIQAENSQIFTKFFQMGIKRTSPTASIPMENNKNTPK